MAPWAEIKEDVEKNNNVVTTTMEVLRDAHGSGRLGVHVLSEIHNELAGIGLGHVPQELPNYQHEQVRIYELGTPLADLITTVMSPGQQNDEKLRPQLAGEREDYASILQKIREVVSE